MQTVTNVPLPWFSADLQTAFCKPFEVSLWCCSPRKWCFPCPCFAVSAEMCHYILYREVESTYQLYKQWNTESKWKQTCPKFHNDFILNILGFWTVGTKWSYSLLTIKHHRWISLHKRLLDIFYFILYT